MKNTEKILRQAIEDWEMHVSQSKQNHTNKGFCRYFYKTQGVDYYNQEIIKKFIPELYYYMNSDIGWINGDLNAYGGWGGEDEKSRKERLYDLERAYINHTCSSIVEVNSKIKLMDDLRDNNVNSVEQYISRLRSVFPKINKFKFSEEFVNVFENKGFSEISKNTLQLDEVYAEYNRDSVKFTCNKIFGSNSVTVTRYMLQYSEKLEELLNIILSLKKYSCYENI